MDQPGKRDGNGGQRPVAAAPAPAPQTQTQTPVAVQAPKPTPRARSASALVLGTVLVLVSALLAGTLAVVTLSPTLWRRVDGIVERTDGTRAVVRYTARGEHHAFLRFSSGVSKGQIVELVYLVNSPSTYDHAGVRWTTLLAFSIPTACALFLLGALILAAA